jgi:hypothetical protein
MLNMTFVVASGSALVFPWSQSAFCECAPQAGEQRSPLILSLQVKAGKSLTSGPAAPPMPLHCSGITTMVIETTLFLAFVMAVGHREHKLKAQLLNVKTIWQNEPNFLWLQQRPELSDR